MSRKYYWEQSSLAQGFECARCTWYISSRWWRSMTLTMPYCGGSVETVEYYCSANSRAVWKKCLMISGWIFWFTPFNENTQLNRKIHRCLYKTPWRWYTLLVESWGSKHNVSTSYNFFKKLTNQWTSWIGFSDMQQNCLLRYVLPIHLQILWHRLCDQRVNILPLMRNGSGRGVKSGWSLCSTILACEKYFDFLHI